MVNPSSTRKKLDQLFALDSFTSVIFGLLALLAPHGILTQLGGGFYNHSVHETLRCVPYLSVSYRIANRRSDFCFRSLAECPGKSKTDESFYLQYKKHRLYGCLRLACGWILWHIRFVDDGMFRRHVCEALFVCYMLQALAVIRAQFTDRHVLINWVAIILLIGMSFLYGSFRFGKGGNLIKIYELPTGASQK